MVRTAIIVATVCGMALINTLLNASEVDNANRLFVLEKYGDAITTYEAIASGENQEGASEALFGIGRAYQMLGRWKQARDSFDRLLRDYPDSELVPRSKIQIGQCEIKLRNLGKALQVFQDVEKNSEDKDAAIEATYSAANLKAGFFGNEVTNALAAIEGYHRVLESSFGERYAVQSHFGLAQCYMRLRNYPLAIDTFGTVIKDAPDTVWATYARDQITNAWKALGYPKGIEVLKQPGETWPVSQRPVSGYLRVKERVSWQLMVGRPTLRIQAIGFFTQSQDAGTGAEKVVYLNPTSYYKNYVFSSDRGTVDRAQRSVEFTGNVKCTDNVEPPTLTVTSGALILDLKNDRAVFSRGARLERRAGTEPIQQLSVPELHLLLDSRKIEVPGE